MSRFLGTVALWLLQTVSGLSPEKPTLTPFFSTVDQAPAFYIECRNSGPSAIASAASVWAWAPGQLKIDGETFRESGGIIGPGLSSMIEPGGSWRGIVTLRQSNTGFSPAPTFGAMVRSGPLAPLQAGRHTVSVRCGDVWSDEYSFFWEAGPQR